MTTKDRLIIFIRSKNLKVRQFERICGLSNSIVYGIRRYPNFETVEKILDKFPELNPGWLLSGKGEMLYSGEPEIQKSLIIVIQQQMKIIEQLTKKS